MDEFQREERYWVIKIKDLSDDQRAELGNYLVADHIPTRECVVVEPDWAIYEMVWHLVERIATNQPLPYMVDFESLPMPVQLWMHQGNSLNEALDKYHQEHIRYQERSGRMARAMRKALRAIQSEEVALRAEILETLTQGE